MCTVQFSAGKENNDPTVEYNLNQQKPKSQVRKVGDQIIMSSAYSSASQIANLRDKAVAKSMDPSYRQRMINDSNNINNSMSSI
jgi:hypothetical protein